MYSEAKTNSDSGTSQNYLLSFIPNRCFFHTQVNLNYKQHSSQMKLSIHSCQYCWGNSDTAFIFSTCWITRCFHFHKLSHVLLLIQATHVLHTTCFPQKEEVNHHSGAYLNHTVYYSSLSDDSALMDWQRRNLVWWDLFFISGLATPPSQMQSEINNSTSLLATASASGFWDKTLYYR